MRKVIQYPESHGVWMPSVIWFDGTTYWQIGRGQRQLIIWWGKTLAYGAPTYNDEDEQRYYLAEPFDVMRYDLGGGQDIDPWFQRCCESWGADMLQVLKLSEVL